MRTRQSGCAQMPKSLPRNVANLTIHKGLVSVKPLVRIHSRAVSSFGSARSSSCPSMHTALWDVFQCSVWHLRSQYHTRTQRLQRALLQWGRPWRASCGGHSWHTHAAGHFGDAHRGAPPRRRRPTWFVLRGPTHPPDACTCAVVLRFAQRRVENTETCDTEGSWPGVGWPSSGMAT